MCFNSFLDFKTFLIYLKQPYNTIKKKALEYNHAKITEKRTKSLRKRDFLYAKLQSEINIEKKNWNDS
jgi:hypothetical protein